MAFPDDWFAGTIKSMGWPRKERRFLRKIWVVDSNVLDRTLDLTIYIGLLIGTDAPEIGTKILFGHLERQFTEVPLGQFMDTDWNNKASLEMYISVLNTDPNRQYVQSNNDIFKSEAPLVRWEDLDTPNVLARFTNRFLCALWLGLTKPQQVAERIDTMDRSQDKDELFKAGLKESAHSREEMLQAALEIVSIYETEREKLKNAPPPLLDYINEQRSSEKA